MSCGGGGSCMWGFIYVFILEKYSSVKTNYNLNFFKFIIIIIGVVNNNNSITVIIIIIIIIIILCDSETIDEFFLF